MADKSPKEMVQELMERVEALEKSRGVQEEMASAMEDFKVFTARYTEDSGKFQEVIDKLVAAQEALGQKIEELSSPRPQEAAVLASSSEEAKAREAVLEATPEPEAEEPEEIMVTLDEGVE